MLLRNIVTALCLLPTCGFTAPAGEPYRLTVLLNYEERNYSTAAFRSMKDEAAAIFTGSGIQLGWITENPPDGRQFDDLFVFKMSGRCAMDPLPEVPDELGLPLGTSAMTDGELLPFGTIECDRIRQALKRAFTPADYRRGDVLFGRALGRVIAHELYHMLADAKSHGAHGVTKATLTGNELCHDPMILSSESLAAIRRQIVLMQKNRHVTQPESSLP